MESGMGSSLVIPDAFSENDAAFEILSGEYRADMLAPPADSKKSWRTADERFEFTGEIFAVTVRVGSNPSSSHSPRKRADMLTAELRRVDRFTLKSTSSMPILLLICMFALLLKPRMPKSVWLYPLVSRTGAGGFVGLWSVLLKEAYPLL
jgi:hypothetical protein